MTTVYLDQNHWVSLGRAYHGKSEDAGISAALTYLQSGVAHGAIVVPLSFVHYMETARITQPERRARLGTVMWELSQGFTIASGREVLINELEQALAKRFPHVTPRPFQLIGRGAAHAFGQSQMAYRLPEAIRNNLADADACIVEDIFSKVIEKSLLTGIDFAGNHATPYRLETYKKNFSGHLAKLRPTLLQLPPKQWDDALNAMSLVDILDPVNEVLGDHGIAWDELTGSGKESLLQFIGDLPSRVVDMHLHRQVARNPMFQPKPGDLEDWAALGLAAAKCDVLVCEKHMADMLGRDGFVPHARVIRRLAELPTVLDQMLS